MDIAQQFIETAKRNPARIVYPEGSDARIVSAAAMARELGIAEPILLGRPEEIAETASRNAVSLEGIRVLSPRDSDRLDTYAASYSRARSLKESIARRVVQKPLCFGGMMVRSGDAEGMLAGVTGPTASVIQAAALTVGYQEGLSTASSFFIMVIPEFGGEKDKILIFADCAVNIAPNPRELAEIAIASGTNAKTLLGIEPRVALLSFSTKGSANHADVDKVVEAVRIARHMEPPFPIDGELQVDAALVPAVAEKKATGSPVAGKANVLVFPNLDAANAAYKLVQRLARATALGPILQGFAKPVNDMSRGAAVADIVAVTAITTVQTQGE